MAWSDIDHENDGKDFEPDFEESQFVAVRCDEEHDGFKCGNYVDIHVAEGEDADPDGVGWNDTTAKALRVLGWKITLDHDYCPVHSNADVKKTDANAVPVAA